MLPPRCRRCRRRTGPRQARQRRLHALTAKRTPPDASATLNRRRPANRLSRRIRRVPSVPRQDRLSAPSPCRRSLSGCRGSAHPCCRRGRSEDNQAHRSPPAALYRCRRPRAGPLSGFPHPAARRRTPHPRPAGRAAPSRPLWWHRQALPRLPRPRSRAQSAKWRRAIRWLSQAWFQDRGHASQGHRAWQRRPEPPQRRLQDVPRRGRHCHEHRQGRRSPRRASVPPRQAAPAKLSPRPEGVRWRFRRPQEGLSRG